MATLDHIGLNRYIYMTASTEDMTLGSHNMDDIKNIDASSIIGASLDDSRLLLGINLYNNGPYGYSSWQQTRMSENPLSRHLRKNNKFPIIIDEEGFEVSRLRDLINHQISSNFFGKIYKINKVAFNDIGAWLDNNHEVAINTVIMKTIFQSY